LILRTIVLSRKSHPELSPLWSILLIFLLTGWQCAYSPAIRAPYSHLTTPAWSQRENYINRLSYFAAEGQINVDYQNMPVNFRFELEYRTLDTLNIQLYDPLGRKLAFLSLFSDEYDVWFQREGKGYSGKGIPPQLTALIDFPFSPKLVRRLLIGLPAEPQDIPVTMMNYRIAPGKPYLRSVVLPDKFVLKYHQYKQYGEVKFAQLIDIDLLSTKTQIQIQFSHFKIEMLKLSRQGN